MRVRIRLARRDGTARASRAGLRPARPHCAQEGEHLRFSPSCESTLFPSGRATRVKAGSRKTATTHLLLQYEGARCHPVGARIARPSRPPCSDHREGCCHPGGVLLNRASARFFAPRCSAQNDKIIVILRSAATKDPARARYHRCRLHYPSCLPFEGRWQRRQALTERSCKELHLRGAASAISWNDPSVTACGRASSPQRGAGFGGCLPEG